MIQNINIIGLIKPDQGYILVDGVDINSIKFKELQKIRSTIEMPRVVALTISLLIICMLLGIFLIVIVPPFTEEFNLLILELPKAAKAIVELTIGTINNIDICPNSVHAH